MTASALQFVGLLVACGGAALALLAADPRLRYTAAAVALVAAPVLVAGDVWHTPRLVELRHDPAKLAALGIGGGAAIVVGAALFRRFWWLFPVLLFAVLPLRVPVQVAGQTAHLLLPLYVVVAAALASSIYALRSPPAGRRPAELPAIRWLSWALAATLVLYAVQAAYSEDVSNAIENAGFFLVPFAVMFMLLREVEWRPPLVGWVLAAVAVMGVAFAAVAFWEYGARDLILNKDLLQSNQLHLDFRVNSIFFDPNIFGRYLTLALVALGAYLAWSRDLSRDPVLVAAAAAVMLVALALTYSITSAVALMAGLVVLIALRWNVRWALGAGAAMVLCGGLFLLVTGTGQTDVSSSQNLDTFAGGRGGLVKGAAKLAEHRPVWGYGSGSFGVAFVRHECKPKDAQCGANPVSHSEPLTVAAEQGALGLVVYIAFVALALAALFRRARTSPAAAGVAACFVALLVHSMGYAGFAIDPASWALLGIGTALAAT